MDAFALAFVPQLLASVAGALVGISGVVLAFRLQARESSRAAYHAAAEQAQGAIARYMREFSRGHPESVAEVSIRIRSWARRASGPRLKLTFRLWDVWSDLASNDDYRLNEESCWIISQAIDDLTFKKDLDGIGGYVSQARKAAQYGKRASR